MTKAFPQRKFLGWNSPFLWEAANELIETARESSSPYDLRKMLVVLPSRRAQRRLTELLVNKAELDNEVLLPPHMLLLGDLGTIFNINKNLSPSQRNLLWQNVIQNNIETATFFYSESGLSNTESQPEDENEDEYEYLKHLIPYLDQLRTTLGKNNLSVSQAINKLGLQEGDTSHHQWTSVDRLISEFNILLLQHGLSDELVLSPEDSLIMNQNLLDSTTTVYLLGCYSISPLEKKYLHAIDNNIYSLIFAPEEHAKGFDAYGNILEEYWESFSNEMIKHSHVQCLGSPLEISEPLLKEIQKAEKSHIPESHITIGILETELIAPISYALEQKGKKVLAPGTRHTGNSTLGSWIILLTEIWAQGDASFKNFLQHPLTKALFLPSLQKGTNKNTQHNETEESDSLAETPGETEIETDLHIERYVSEDLDALLQQTLQTSLESLSKLSSKRQERLTAVRRLLVDAEIKKINECLSTFEFCKKIQVHILAILQENADSQKIELSESNEIISLLEKLFEFSSVYKDQISSYDFHILLKDTFYRKELPPLQEEGIELLGWYEIFLDDASCKIISGCNEELLPEKIMPDPLLPHQSRKILGIETNNSIFAENKYQFCCIFNSTKQIKFFTSQKNIKNERLKISRLLLPFGTEVCLKILEDFYSNKSSVDKAISTQNHHDKKLSSSKKFPFYPHHVPYQEFPLTQLSASAIKSYIRCPYEFYLRYILKLESLEIESIEIPLPLQGTILHECARFITLQNAAYGSDYNSILEYGTKVFEKEIYSRFGKNLSVTFRLQIENLKRKLKLFCLWHYESKKEGWQNIACEYPLPEVAVLKLSNNQKIPFKGSIDRVDYNPKSNTIRIIDIKTSDNAYTFNECVKKETWIDPQLPLYGKFIRESLAALPINTGSDPQIELLLLSLSSEPLYKVSELSLTKEIEISALEATMNVVENIRSAVFWPPKNLSPLFYERIFGSSTPPKVISEDQSLNEVQINSSVQELR